MLRCYHGSGLRVIKSEPSRIGMTSASVSSHSHVSSRTIAATPQLTTHERGRGVRPLTRTFVSACTIWVDEHIPHYRSN